MYIRSTQPSTLHGMVNKYQPKGGDALWLERLPQAWQKVMAWSMTYNHLQADCLYTEISSGPNAR